MPMDQAIQPNSLTPADNARILNNTPGTFGEGLNKLMDEYQKERHQTNSIWPTPNQGFTGSEAEKRGEAMRKHICEGLGFGDCQITDGALNKKTVAGPNTLLDGLRDKNKK